MGKKSTKGKTSDELIKDFPSWKASRFRDFWKHLPTGSKQQAVLSYDIAAATVEIADEINIAAKHYAKQCEKSDRFRKHASTWLNQADWETQVAVKDKAVVDPKYCQCGEPATQLHPEPLCCKCWADKHSTQMYEGKPVPYKYRLADAQKRLVKLIPKNGETNDAYSERCRQWLLSKFQLGRGRSEGLRHVVSGKGNDGSREGGR